MSRRREVEALCDVPKDQTAPFTPWSLGELELMFASARTMPGDVAGIDARRWWSALLALIVDTARPVSELLALEKADYDHSTGTLCVNRFAFRLHPKAVEVLDTIRRHDHGRLLPWLLDNGRPPFHILLRDYKQLLFRANLPTSTADMFHRLQRTGRAMPDVLGELSFSIDFAPRLDRLRFARARDRERWEQLRAEDPTGNRKRRRRQTRTTATDTIPIVSLIVFKSDRSLRRLFIDSYRPQRLADKETSTAEKYLSTLNFLAKFCLCEPTVDCLTDDLLERFMAWIKATGRANATCNTHRAHLLALWRHAWRKRLLIELPREVRKYKVAKRVPEAWNADQVGLILRTAAATPGTICGIPAGQWWPALILTLYDTGLRIAAAMQIRASDLNVNGWLTVPAEAQKQDADQVFRLHPQTVQTILESLHGDRQYLFPWAIDSDGHFRYLARAYGEILKRAGLPHGKRDLFHKLRRTSATAIADAFDIATAQRHLGHSSLQVTRSYVDPTKLRNNHSGAEAIKRPNWRVVSADDADAVG